MRVCTARQMAEIDRETIAAGVPGLELMERAGAALTELTLEFLAGQVHDHGHGCGDGCGGHDDEPAAPRVLILCGKGNNGGDGLVMARLLDAAGVQVKVLLLAAADALSPEARANLDRLPQSVRVAAPDRQRWASTARTLLNEADAAVDAIFGTGITPPLHGEILAVIRAVNDAGLPVLAVDIPSGVDGNDGRVDPVAVAADLTVTIGLPKRGLLLAPGRDFTGELEVVDIGFAPEVCARHAPDHHWLEPGEALALLPPRPTATHKGRCGSLLLVAGSRRYGGAAHLAALGALRSGAGLVTAAVPAGLETALRAGLPEALIAPCAETAAGTLAPLDEAALAGLLSGRDAVALGPGLGDDPLTDAWAVDFLATAAAPLVVDADGLNAFARLGRIPAFAHRRVVLTPHPGELARLTGLTTAEVVARRLELAVEVAGRWGAVVLLKGSPALIAAPDGRLFFNAAGDDALARGGSGDVLTGLIGGLLAQGLDALEAALLGALVHGRAGTLAAATRSSRSVLVREVADAIGPVFLEMERQASGDAALRERLWPTVGRGDA